MATSAALYDNVYSSCCVLLIISLTAYWCLSTHRIFICTITLIRFILYALHFGRHLGYQIGAKTENIFLFL